MSEMTNKTILREYRGTWWPIHISLVSNETP
jgi:hypothetical protein